MFTTCSTYSLNSTVHSSSLSDIYSYSSSCIYSLIRMQRLYFNKYYNVNSPPPWPDISVNQHVHINFHTRYVTLSAGSIGIYDPTEIRNRGALSRFQKETFIKIGVHLVTFFISLYG